MAVQREVGWWWKSFIITIYVYIYIYISIYKELDVMYKTNASGTNSKLNVVSGWVK